MYSFYLVITNKERNQIVEYYPKLHEYFELINIFLIHFYSSISYSLSPTQSKMDKI